MENKAHALMAGIFTIVLLIAAALIALWFNRDHEDLVPYEIATTLSVPGLNPQAGVRYRGLSVGRVDAVLFDPKKAGQILIRFSVTKDTPITHSTFATLSYQGVTGLAYVQLDDDDTNLVLLPSSHKNVARIELRPGLLDKLQLRGLAILKQTEDVAVKLNTLLSANNQKTIISAFTNVGNAAHAIGQIPGQLQPTIDKLPALTAKADSVLTSLDKLSANATTLTGNLNEFTTKLNAADGPVTRFNSAVDEVGTAATAVDRGTGPLVDETRNSMRALNRTLDTFNQRPQSILFGPARAQPGPGEAGFSAPAQQDH